jgi:hypothetical protein
MKKLVFIAMGFICTFFWAGAQTQIDNQQPQKIKELPKPQLIVCYFVRGIKDIRIDPPAFAYEQPLQITVLLDVQMYKEYLASASSDICPVKDTPYLTIELTYTFKSYNENLGPYYFSNPLQLTHDARVKNDPQYALLTGNGEVKTKLPVKLPSSGNCTIKKVLITVQAWKYMGQGGRKIVMAKTWECRNDIFYKS